MPIGVPLDTKYMSIKLFPVVTITLWEIETTDKYWKNIEEISTIKYKKSESDIDIYVKLRSDHSS